MKALDCLSTPFNQLPNIFVILVGGGRAKVKVTVRQSSLAKGQVMKRCSIVSCSPQKTHFVHPFHRLLAKLSFVSTPIPSGTCNNNKMLKLNQSLQITKTIKVAELKHQIISAQMARNENQERQSAHSLCSRLECAWLNMTGYLSTERTKKNSTRIYTVGRVAWQVAAG
jgi:hypothetical protein